MSRRNMYRWRVFCINPILYQIAAGLCANTHTRTHTYTYTYTEVKQPAPNTARYRQEDRGTRADPTWALAAPAGSGCVREAKPPTELSRYPFGVEFNFGAQEW